MSLCAYCLLRAGLMLKWTMSITGVQYSVNAKSAVAFEHCRLYKDVVTLLRLSGQFHRRKFERAPFTVLESIFKKYRENFGIEFSSDPDTRSVQEQVLTHIEGVAIGLTIVSAWAECFTNTSWRYLFKAEEFHDDAESFAKILDFFAFLGWFEKEAPTYRFTEKGLFFAAGPVHTV